MAPTMPGEHSAVYSSDSQGVFHGYNLSMDPALFWFHEDQNKIKTWDRSAQGRSWCLGQFSEWLVKLTRPRTYAELKGLFAFTETAAHPHTETQND